MTSETVDCARCLIGIEKIDNIDAEITLQPDNIPVCSVKGFDNVWIGKSFVKSMQLASYCWYKRVDNVVMRDGRNLSTGLSTRDYMIEPPERRLTCMRQAIPR